MPYDMDIRQEALETLRVMPEAVKREIGYRLHCLAQNFSGDVKKLRGSRNEYRLRVGNWRILFELNQNQISVYAISPRKDVYK